MSYAPKRVALAVMRTQPPHRGHTAILNRMCEDYGTVILAMGSADSPITEHDPWPIEIRKQMIRNIYGNRIKLVPLADIGSEQGSGDWCNYVLQKIKAIGLPDPTDYFTGSHADAVWYKGHFFDGDESNALAYAPENRRYWIGEHFTPDVDLSPGIAKHWATLRRLHIVDRDANPVPPATDLRTFLRARNDGWKQWVPAVNHELVESTYPEEFRVKKSD